MLKHYETVFIITPVLSEEQIKETVEKYKIFLSKKQAEMVYTDNWGLRKLAYPIRKMSNGIYCLFEYKADGKTVAELEVQFKRDEKVLRFLTVALDKHAIAYNEKKRKEKTKAIETSEEKH